MSYCLKCKVITNDIDPQIVTTKNNRRMKKAKCEKCKTMKSVFVKGNEQEGEGIKEVAQKELNFFDALINGKRKGLSPSFKATLKANEEKQIIGITLVRKPVQKVLTSIINIITLGKFNDQVKALNYDQVYHLSAVLKLGDGNRLLLEKNAVPELKPIKDIQGETFEVNMKKPINLKSFIKDTVNKVGSRYVEYTAENLNCQRYLIDHLETNNLITASAKKWVLQDAAQLLSKDPSVFKALKAVTDIGALGDIVQNGRGIGDDIKKFFVELITAIPGKTDYSKMSDLDWAKLEKSNQSKAEKGAKLMRVIKKL